MKMNTHVQIPVLAQAIKSLNNYIKNADLDKETNIDLIFGDDCEASAIEVIELIGKSFESFQVLYNDEIVTAEQLTNIVNDFTDELESLRLSYQQ